MAWLTSESRPASISSQKYFKKYVFNYKKVLTDSLHELIEVLRWDHFVFLANELHFFKVLIYVFSLEGRYNRARAVTAKTRMRMINEQYERMLPANTRNSLDSFREHVHWMNRTRTNERWGEWTNSRSVILWDKLCVCVNTTWYLQLTYII